jgi:hypothetical protein
MEYKNQHVVTHSYLQKWCDPETPIGHTPYVWLVSKDGQSIDKKAPINIFTESDFYTVIDEKGNRNLELEHYLQKIEDGFLKTRSSILEKRPITEQDFQSLVLFIASTYTRTKLQKREQKDIWKDLLSIYKNMGIDQFMPDVYKKIEDLYYQPLPYHLSNFLNITVPILQRMNLRVLETYENIGFITSDNPVLWLDPTLLNHNEPISFFGLDSPDLEIILPLSPNFLAQLSWKYPEQYLEVDTHQELVDEINKLIVYFSDEFVVLNHNKPNPYWFEVN